MNQPKTVLATKSWTIDLEYKMMKIEKGKTYFDDGTTVFDVYIRDGLNDGSFVESSRKPNTVIVTAPSQT